MRDKDKKVQIRVAPSDLLFIRECLEKDKKIAAIKHARLVGKAFPPQERAEPCPDNPTKTINVLSHKVGLREAKHAVEVLAGQITPAAACAEFGQTLRIKKVTIEGQHGDVELDLDELQLRVLDGLGKFPFSEMTAMVELMQFLRDWDRP